MKGRQLWAALILVVSTAVIATLAVLYPGFATADVRLNDGGVWVTQSVNLRVGHLNYPSRVLDGSVLTRAAEFELLQDGNDVLVFDPVLGTLTQLDPAKVEFLGDGSLTTGSRVDLHAGLIGLIDAGNNGLYVLKPVSVPGFATVGRDPLADLGDGSVVAVGTQGTVFAASAERGELVTVEGEYGEPVTKSFGKVQPGAELAITAVGDTPVVLDSASGVVYVGDRTIELPAAKGGRLQAAGPAGERVVIATKSGLLAQPLDGGESTLVPVAAGGDPAQPVVVGSCAYAVWSGSAAYVRDCAVDADDRNEVIPGAPAQARLTLRSNRNVVVVNELGQGLNWLVDENMLQVSNWQDTVPPPEPQGEEESEDTKTQFTLPKREPENSPPTAENDDFGVRAGSTAVLSVLDNDSDPDGDLLAASLVGDAPSNVAVQPVGSGAALQVTAAANAAGTLTFRYQVDDGREGGTDEAQVTLKVLPAGQNSPPKQKKVHTVLLELGATATYDALMGWSDPDGDDIYLKRAWSEAGDRVTYRSNGVIQFTEAVGERGIHEVKLLVSDGSAEFQGLLRVDVRARNSLAPIANADRYSTMTGDPITIAPIANDLSTSGKQLRLAKLDQVSGAKLVPDFSAGTFSFEAPAPGTYYVQYLVTDGPNAADGIVRVDVKAAGADDLDPLASKDVALLQPSREALVDVLANDTDPTGGILVVQSVTVPDGSQVAAEVLEHRVLRIKDTGGLRSPTTISYRVSNGARWADGQVRVIPIARPEKSVGPVTTDDRAIVRAGDIVTIDVLANDYHPGGDAIELLPALKETPDPADGVAFVSEGKVRFRAGANEKAVALVYEVTDSDDNVKGGYIRIQVTAPGAEDNSEPLPESVTARAIAGTAVRVPVPLDGIDPDGDSVELVGVTSAAKQGRVTVGDTWLVYEAYPGATGRDSFGYVVRDRLGATAAGSVVVGVAAPSNQNQAPYTVRDEVQVRPGRSVSVPVLKNDSDPDGDDVGLSSKGLTAPDGVTAEVVKSRLLVQAPTTEGDYSITYTAVDDYGARSQGSLILTVSEEAPLEAPIARDDRVQPQQLGSGKTVEVAVLENDEDPDGVAEQLKVTADDPNATVRTDGALTVTLTPEPQLVLYTVTDQDGQATSAAVFVPGTETLLPTLKSTEPLEVVAGKELRIPLVEHVMVRSGHKPRVAEADSVRAAHAGGKPLVADESMLTYTSDPEYFGPDAISVRITDGEGPDDPEGNSAYLSIPVLVLPATNQPPTFLNTLVQVAPGEEPAELNLRKLSSDPDPDDLAKLTFRATAPAGFQARVDGDHLLVSADSSTAQGTAAEILVEVSDGTSTPTTGRVAVLVTTSQRPLPVAVDDAIERADQGRPVEVDVLRNDTNPFPDTPLAIIGTEVVSGRGTLEVNGSKVVVTPAADFVGTLQATYRIQDATKSPEREAEGTIRVTVQGAPDRPSKPVVVTVGDRTVVLQWEPPSNNGRPITGYAVSSKVEGFSQNCSSTTCTLKGLTNNVEYTFTVVATNDVGDSEPSTPSAVARPDTRPDTPAPPKLEFGDKSLTVTWQTPHSSGSPVHGYNLEISPAPEVGGMQQPNITGNKYVWKGLKNGTAYQVKVQALNRAPEPSEWSQYSKAEVPAGPPAAPGRPTTDPATAVGSQAQLHVEWPAVTGEAANGDEVDHYTLKVIHGGSSKSIEVRGTSQNITVDPSSTDYTFQVTATNKAGDSDPSPVSAPRRAAVAPAAPQNVEVEPGDKRIKLSFSGGDLNGSRAGEITYHYEVNQTGSQGTISSGDWITGLNNGTRYTVDVWATSSVDGVKPGKRATSNAATPFGKPIITLDGIDRLDNAVRFRWHVDDNGSKLTTEEPKLSGNAGSVTKGGLAAGELTSLTVTYGNEADTVSQRWEGRANDPPPPPSVTVHNDGYAGVCTELSSGPCYHIGVETRNFTGNVTCTLDGSYATTFGPNQRKRLTGQPWRGLNITFTVTCGGVSRTGKMPAP